MSRTAELLSEVHLNALATMEPGAILPLGDPLPHVPWTDITFTYVDSTSVGSWEGYAFPEPASLSLLGLGALAMIRRRR